MPHKRNPIGTENMTGQARIIRAAVTPALENVALWHERDISHSAVERTILPDALISADYAINRLAGIIDKLLVYPDTMIENLEKMGGLVFSQKVLLTLTQNGISREDAYRIVQRNAMQVWESKGKTTLKEFLEQDEVVTDKLDKDTLDSIFNYDHYTKHIPTILDRTYNN